MTNNKNISRTILGTRYTITLILVLAIILWGGQLFHSADITWALISAVVCTELEIDQAYTTIIRRIIATLIGVIIATGALIIFGINYFTLFISVTLTTLLCYFLFPTGNSWKLATATGVMVLAASLQQHSISFAEQIAVKRAIEVMAGSIIAGIVSLLGNKLWSIFSRKKKE